MLAESGVAPETLRDAVLACGKQAITDLIDVRGREGAQLATMLLANVTEMEAIVTKITPLVPELIAKHQQKIVERLQEALGIAAPDTATTSISREEIAERIRQEVTMYGIRIDIAEELSRLTAHLNETRHVIEKGGKVGKRLDFMMQELNREANTLGSKAAAKELADSSMTLEAAHRTDARASTKSGVIFEPSDTIAMTDHTRESSAPRNPYAGAYPGNLFMVVAPSGAGKSTLVNALLAQRPGDPPVDLVHDARRRVRRRRTASTTTSRPSTISWQRHAAGRVPRKRGSAWQLLCNFARVDRRADEERP